MSKINFSGVSIEAYKEMSLQNLFDNLNELADDDYRVLLSAIDALVTGVGGDFGDETYKKMSSILRVIFGRAMAKDSTFVSESTKELESLVAENEKAAPEALLDAINGATLIGNDEYMRMRTIFRQIFNMVR